MNHADRTDSPIVVSLMGIPGAGKTSLAQWLVQHEPSLRIISRDLIREAMFVPCFFTNEEKTAAYEAVKLAIPVVVLRGNSVVIDGMCFSQRGVLEEIEQIAVNVGARSLSVFCKCPLEIAIARVERDRESGSHSAQDRDATLVRRVFADFRTLPQRVITVDSSASVDDVGKEILTYISKTS
jgi:thymidylate kinase